MNAVWPLRMNLRSDRMERLPTNIPTQPESCHQNFDEVIDCLEHRMGFEPMNTGFADQRVSHFAIGAS